jgi:hypothetical protein
MKDIISRNRFGFLLLAASLAGFYLGIRLPEERRVNLRRMLSELRELPFRLFV